VGGNLWKEPARFEMTHEEEKRQRADALTVRVAELAARGWITGRNRAFVLEWKEHIADQLASGYTWKVIWSALKEMGGTSMCYNSFRRHCRAVGLERAGGNRRQVKPEPKAQLASRGGRLVGQPSGPTVFRPRAMGEGFVHPNDVDLTEYYKPKTNG